MRGFQNLEIFAAAYKFGKFYQLFQLLETQLPAAILLAFSSIGKNWKARALLCMDVNKIVY